ncbi:ABC transporter substrate-binding protein [Consotaella aegiceratis]|uniref:ABC transporter substrate-binding protein n=1 Tax=Consotaella aegiceratis TaxID=3097961 RepID=UPI002F3ED046
MILRRTLLAAIAATAALPFLTAPTLAADPIKLGEINSYTGLPAFTVPYKKGWQLALDQINAAGGIDGRPLEVISRDDNGQPADAIRVAEELVASDRVAMIWGGYFSNIGLALSDFAKQRKVLYLATEPLTDALVWSQGNRYTWRLRPSTFMQAAMLAEEAAKLDATRWATIAPNYAYGQDAVAAFKSELKRLKPEVEFVEEQWPTQGKIDAGSTVRALEAAKPDAIYNVTFAGDLAKFVREGDIRGLFDGRDVVSLLSGEPDYLEPLGGEAPEGWIVTGYPWYGIDTPEHQAFLKAYEDKYGEHPMTGSLVGYNAMQSIAAALKKAGSADPDDLLAAMENLEVDAPSGTFHFRAADHQATMGAWVGKTALKDGGGVMVDWHYADGADYLPSPEEAAAMRPAE